MKFLTLFIYGFFLACSGVSIGNASEPLRMWELELVDKEMPEKIVVIENRDWIRVDLPNQRYSIIYNEKDQSFVGMEHRDGTYWNFKWAEVAVAAERSRRNLRKFKDLNIQGFASYDLSRPDDPSILDKKYSIQWEESSETKEILKWKTRRWIGTGEDRRQFKAWCAEVDETGWAALIPRLVEFNKRVTLSVVRPLWPEWMDQLLLSLHQRKKLMISVQWGGETEPLSLRLVDNKKIDPEGRWFEVSSKYRPSRPEALAGFLQSAEDGGEANSTSK